MTVASNGASHSTTSSSPLRVAIIGSGPAAFYTADSLLKASPTIEIDMYERLITPYGLVRGGVAPDHPKIKSVTKVYERIASNPRFRYLGGVTFGEDVTRADLEAHYHQIVYAVGAQADRKMNIPGEDLPGSFSATEFVGWYNAHPDFRDCNFDLSQKAVAIIGNGNVAMDVARILARTPEELGTTDIADEALAALAHSKVEDIYIIGRRGPAQAAYTNAEIKEMGDLADADIMIPPSEAALDPLTNEDMLAGMLDKVAVDNIRVVQEYAAHPTTGRARRVHFLFLRSPLEILGQARVEGIKLVTNELTRASDGSLRPRATEKTEIIAVGLVFRSIGYQSLPLPDVPFNPSQSVITNVEGRVVENDTYLPLIGHYVAGWAKRGPSGVIGTNKPDGVATAAAMLEDAAAGKTLHPTQPTADAADTMLAAKGLQPASFADWLLLDSYEQALGQAQGRPRVKSSDPAAMRATLAAIKQGALAQAAD